ncbi:MAG: hypothetical protein LBS64_00140 [Spirochaetaceae bacterium]|nr:hypothetical protein [Spirochaetaceae bacterium]
MMLSMKGMKKNLILTFTLGVLAISAVQAQQAPQQDAAAQGSGAQTYFSAMIYRIRLYKNAYVITYAKHDTGSGQLIVPFNWITGDPVRLQVRWTNKPILPYISVFYNDAGFNFIKLTLPASRQDALVEYIRKEIPQGNLPTDTLEDFKF